MDMFDQTAEKKQKNIKLYVRRVFVLDTSELIIPNWLSFVRGIIDSEDLPLNISRESLQQNRILRVIKKTLIKKSIEMMQELTEDNTAYTDFYGEFSKNIKLGIHEDPTYKDRLAPLLRYYSTESPTVFVSLDQYVERMPKEQTQIYYISGESTHALTNSPFLEQFKQNKYEVLFFTEPIDEYMIPVLKNYKDFKIVSITDSDLSLKSLDETTKKLFEKTCSTIKEILGDELTRVLVSNRVTDSPCVIVSDKYGVSANMERLMKAQTLQNNDAYTMKRRVMEINPTNPIILSLYGSIEKVGENAVDKIVKDLVWLLYENALIHSGFSLNDPAKFSSRINRLIHLGLGLDDDDEADEQAQGEEQGEEQGEADEQAQGEEQDEESVAPIDICDEDDTMEQVD
jgi:molecular chaperone HtpG